MALPIPADMLGELPPRRRNRLLTREQIETEFGGFALDDVGADAGEVAEFWGGEVRPQEGGDHGQ